MTRRITRHPQDNPHGEAEVETTATCTAIAELRRRLKRHGIEHPSVRRELGKLEQLLITLFDQGKRTGRHRSQPGTLPDAKPARRPADTEVADKPGSAEATTGQNSSVWPSGIKQTAGIRLGDQGVPSDSAWTTHDKFQV
jgi:hypothetical protein